MTSLAVLSSAALAITLDTVSEDQKSVAVAAFNYVAAGDPGAMIVVDGSRLSAEEITLQLALDGFIDSNA